jgi:hypothetical protein
MSPAPDQTPKLAVNCSNCGRENAIGRLFCQFCGHRIIARSQSQPDLNAQPGPSAEGQPTQATLEAATAEKEAAKAENQALRQQLQSIQEELSKIKTTSAAPVPSPQPSPVPVAEFETKLKSAEDRAARMESQSADWQEKWKSAEQKAAAFEEQMVAKAKELEAVFQANSAAKTQLESAAKTQLESAAKPQSSNRLKIIASIVTLVGGLGGYGAGHYTQPSDDSKTTLSQLSAQVKAAQTQNDKLQASLDSANQKASQLENDSKLHGDSASQKISELTGTVAARDGQLHLMEGKLASAQRDLAASETRLNAATATGHSTDVLAAQRLTQLTTSNQRVQQLESQIQARDGEIATLRARINNLSNSTTQQRSGTLTWTGTVAGKRKVDIQNGVPDWGSITGALPRIPCAVSSPDHVQFKTRPSEKNQWNRVAFEVSGTGERMQVRITCSATQ